MSPIIVVYCLAPHSSVHSIWRAAAPGGVEPFRHFYQTIWMESPQFVKALTLAEMKADPILSEMPLVRGNMQGINGRHIPRQFYNRLVYLFEKSGTPKGSLPTLDNIEREHGRIRTERAVEEHVLEPFLRDLGFKPEDWERQVQIRVGRNERAIPDYLIHVTRAGGSRAVHADWVWEAKLDIASHDQLHRDLEQACSYAKLVNAQGIGLISRQGVWVSLKGDGYHPDKVQHWPFQQIKELDRINEIRSLAGKKHLSSKR
jgi:hypothetical protein